jgi:hypothetical protein
VLIDTSDSMRDEVIALCALTASVVKTAAASCPTNLRVQWFGIEGTWPDTQVTQSYRHYLQTRGVANAALLGRAKDTVPHQGAQEDGARAITDLARHFDWRPGATRLLLYLSDEALEGGDPSDVAEQHAIEAAIAAAQTHAVHLFTYLGTGQETGAFDAATHFQAVQLATATGGQAYTAPYENLRDFQAALQQFLCAKAGDGSTGSGLPVVQPCFVVHWGDGPTDRIETFDHETLCLEAYNPYCNVIFHELIIVRLVITLADGTALPRLPDGALALTLHPASLIAFPALTPYTPATSEQAWSNSREVLLISTGAHPGDYRLTIHYRCRAEIVLSTTDDFPLALVASA